MAPKRLIVLYGEDVAEDPVGKKQRSASAPASLGFSAQAGAGERTQEISEASDEIIDPAFEGFPNSVWDTDDVMREKIQDVVNKGGVLHFAQYAQSVLEMEDDEDGRSGAQLSSLSLLMRNHDIEGAFWTEAWPIEVYAKYYKKDVSFETLWSGAYGDNIFIDPLDDETQTKRKWYEALRSYIENGAETKAIVEFADHFADAINLASRGNQTPPPIYQPGETHVDYLAALKIHMKRTKARLSWTDATERLRTAFGDSAADELSAVSHDMTGDLEPCENYEREIWWRRLYQSVVAPVCRHTKPLKLVQMCSGCMGKRQPTARTAWFQAQFDYIQNCGYRLNCYSSTHNLEACVAYVQQRGTYEAMCPELDLHIRDLRRTCMSASKAEWVSRMKAETTRSDRDKIYKMFHLMRCH